MKVRNLELNGEVVFNLLLGARAPSPTLSAKREQILPRRRLLEWRLERAAHAVRARAPALPAIS